MKYFSMTGQDKETWGLGRAALPKAQCFSSTTAGYRELPCHKVTTAMRRGGGLYSEGKLVCIPTTPRSHISPRRACPQRLWWPNKGLFPSLPFQVSSGCSANKPQLKPLISSSQKHCAIPFFLIYLLVFPVQHLPPAVARHLQTT